MSKKLTSCPSCGSNDVLRNEKESRGHLTLGQEFFYNEIIYKCNSCEEEGDFNAENDESFLKGQKDAQAIFTKNILENMSNVGITMAMFERVFELPARTLTRWKNGDFSASALALLRIIATYPWIIEVAEHKFERNYASFVVIKVAANELLERKNTAILHYNDNQTALENPIPTFSNKNVLIGA